MRTSKIIKRKFLQQRKHQNRLYAWEKREKGNSSASGQVSIRLLLKGRRWLKEKTYWKGTIIPPEKEKSSGAFRSQAELLTDGVDKRLKGTRGLYVKRGLDRNWPDQLSVSRGKGILF